MLYYSEENNREDPMKNKKYIFFDLDGTLIDSQEGITKAVAHALTRFGIEVEDLKQLRPFIGPPLAESFIKYFDFTEEKAKEAVSVYREYYSVTGKFENQVYAGVPQMLERLQKAGKKLILATSKPEIFAKQIMEHFHLQEYFTAIYGADMDGIRVKKDDVIRYALTEMEITDISQVIMIGDREHDVIGAKKCGIDTIGVLYGFGSRDELEENGAVVIVEKAEEVAEIILE